MLDRMKKRTKKEKSGEQRVVYVDGTNAEKIVRISRNDETIPKYEIDTTFLRLKLQIHSYKI